MTGRGLALIAATRRALAALPGAASVHVVRDRRSEDVPLAQHAAHLIQPLSSHRLQWSESADWQYELAAFSLTTLARGRPGTAAQVHLAELHEAALQALRSSDDLLSVVVDGPPCPHSGAGDRIDAVRWGPTEPEHNRPGDPLAITTTVALVVPVSEPETSVLLDDADLFASGPHELVPGTPQRAVGQHAFSGLAGALLIDLGRRPRTLTLRGRLSAATAAGLAQLEAAIEARIDGRLHALTGRDSTAYPRVRLDRFTRRAPVETGLRFHRPYELDLTDFLYGPT